ncbi:uncharacterized protein LOC132631469 [Lycium barbarum]|uniref:uncharacterized protein LOC132631469 n=1 Tax=Lycium barbarum TaxID=112863 RepID=UPI00293F2C69|nr:uncharacterized protein LOC132631469 [Lycium barbarum]
MIWNLLSNVWYSVILNGKRHGFFKSERGVKQGDPISPSLFIIVVEVLSMLLNNLFDKPEFNGFSMQPNGPKINHISYADDIIIFCSGKTATLKLIMATLTQYELNSVQLINKEKSCFLVADDISTKRKNIILRNLNFQEKQFPITYLGCPLFVGRKKIQYFTEAATKIIQKVDSWQGKMLSTGGKIVLIKHVLSAMPIHLLSICQPPKNILQQIEGVFANFFWGTHEGPKKSLWTDYLKVKYCKRVHPLARKFNYAHSHAWRRMMKIRHRVDHLILCRLIQPIWTVTASGRFDCNSAWNKLRTPHISSMINMMIWHKKCPFKVSFFLWRILKNKTYVDVNLGRLGINLPSICSCCVNHAREDEDHLFLKGRIARMARNSFCIIQVKWNPPNNGWVKINSDGCSKGNPGLSGSGGVIRNHLGNLVMAYAMNLNIQTNNYAEAIALKSGIDWCINNGKRKVMIETDSMMLIHWILDIAYTPWPLQNIILDIKTQLNFFEDKTINHCFRECNKVADCLANFGLNCNGTIWLDNSQMLPKEVKGEINMDKLQLPSFIMKHLKNSFYLDKEILRMYNFDVP